MVGRCRPALSRTILGGAPSPRGSIEPRRARSIHVGRCIRGSCHISVSRTIGIIGNLSWTTLTGVKVRCRARDDTGNSLHTPRDRSCRSLATSNAMVQRRKQWLGSSPRQRPVGLRGVWVVAAREALAQIAARGGVAASFREVAFPMASAKEHQSRTETFARRSILCDASAPQRLARRPYCLGPTVGSDQSESVDSARCKSASMLYIGVGL